MSNGLTMDREQNTVKLNIGDRNDFDIVEFTNTAGLKVGLYKNGGTHCIGLGDLMVSQMEGHPFQGGLDRVYLRNHTASGIEAFPM